MSAHDILQAAAGHMKDRAATYDKPEGERSMGATVAAFKAIAGHDLTEEQGWLFMALLKAVRSQQGAYRQDSYEDGAAYFALAGEAAARDRKKAPIVVMNARGKVVLDGHEVDTDFDTEKTRMPQVGTNGNEGEHYGEVGDGWVVNSGQRPDLHGDTEVQYIREDGLVYTNQIHRLSWTRDGLPADIVRYRIVEDR